MTRRGTESSLRCRPSDRELAASGGGRNPHRSNSGGGRGPDLAGRANQFAFAIVACPAPFAKIFLFFRNPNQFYIRDRPVPKEGRVAIVTAAGRDAVDAEAPITNGVEADGKDVWS